MPDDYDEPSTISVAGSDRVLARILMATMSRRGPLAAGILSAILGPVVLAVWWSVGASAGWWPTELAGFWADWAPTAGDALLLSCLVATTLAAYRDLGDLSAALTPRPARFNGAWWAFGPVVAAVASVTLVHTVWLTNPSITPNWTLPRPGALAAPGFYHAAYVALLLYWFIAFIARCVMILRAASGERSWTPELTRALLRIRQKATAAGALLVAYAALLYVDNYGYSVSLDGLRHSWSTVAVLICAVAFAAVPTWWFWVRFARMASGMSDADAAAAVLTERAAWLIPFVAALTVLLAWLLESLSPWPLLAAVTVAVACISVENGWFDIYPVQDRTASPDAWLVLTVVAAALAAGFLVAARAVVTVPIPADGFGSLPIRLWSAPVTSLAAMGGGLAILAWLLGHAKRIKPGELTREPAFTNLWQNAVQYWGMLQLVVLPVAFYTYGRVVAANGTVTTMEHLLIKGVGPATVVALLFGYFSVVTFGLGFTLTNSWRHIAALEAEKAEDQKHPDSPRRADVALIKANIMFVSAVASVLTALMLLVLWLGTLARFIAPTAL